MVKKSRWPYHLFKTVQKYGKKVYLFELKQKPFRCGRCLAKPKWMGFIQSLGGDLFLCQRCHKW